MDERVVIFDVMGTIFDLSALDARFAELGAAPAVREAWFERLLDTSKALTIVGEFEPFGDLALSCLRTTLAGQGLDPNAAGPIVEALAEVPAYADAKPALDRLGQAGAQVVALTNSGAGQTEALLERAGLKELVRRVFSAEEVKAYKPDPRPYRHACEQLGVEPARAVLVAAHGWDVVGARAAGLDTIWVDRIERCWPFPGAEPERRAHDLAQAAETLLASVPGN